MKGKDTPKLRREYLAAELRNLGADCAVVSHPKHIFYFSGVPTNLNLWFSVMKGPRLTSILIVDSEGRGGLLAGSSELAGIRASGGDDALKELELGLMEYTDYSLSEQMVVYGDRLSKEMKGWLSSMTRKFGKVAVEGWHLPQAYSTVLSEVLPESNLIGISDFLLAMRNSKGADEIRRLEHATKIVDRSYQTAKEGSRTGRVELDVYGEINAHSFRKHGPFAWVVGDYASGERALSMGGAPTPRKMKRGDTIILDLQAQYENYWSDLCRTFVIGRTPNLAQQRVLSVLKEAKSAAEAILLPGTEGGEVYRAVSDVLVKAGYPKLPHHAGHGIGLDDQEPPWFIPAESRKLEEGSVCVVEPGIYQKTSGGIRIEDQYVITGKGPRKLSRCPLALA